MRSLQREAWPRQSLAKGAASARGPWLTLVPFLAWHSALDSVLVNLKGNLLGGCLPKGSLAKGSLAEGSLHKGSLAEGKREGKGEREEGGGKRRGRNGAPG